MKKILVLIVLIMIVLFIFRDDLLQGPFWGRENTLGIFNGLLGFIILLIIYSIAKRYIEKGSEKLKEENKKNKSIQPD